MATELRARNWTFIIYPDECFENWKDILRDEVIPCAVSPLHSPEDSEKKKHHHILIAGDKKSASQIYDEVCKKLGSVFIENGTEKIKGVTNVKKVQNIKSLVRYFLHLDNPDKEQFEESKKIECFGGFHADKYLLNELDEKIKEVTPIKGILKIVNEKNFENIADLLSFLSDKDDELFLAVCKNAYLVTQILNKYRKDFHIKGVKK